MERIAALRAMMASSLPARAIERFGGNADSAGELRCGANATLRFDGCAGPAFLRITAASLRSADELRANLAYLQYLADEGAPVSTPLRARDGEPLLVLPDPDPAFGETWLVSAVAAVPGAVVGNRCTEAPIYRAWGAAMARLHRAAERFRPQNAARYYDLDRAWALIQRALPRFDAPLRAEAMRLADWCAARERKPPAYGLTHGDFNAGNVLWDGARVHIIDFDEPMWNWFAADLARPFHELRDRATSDVAAWADALLEGYRSERPFPATECDAIAWLLRLKALEMLAFLEVDWLDDEMIGGEPREAALRRARACVLEPSALAGR